MRSGVRSPSAPPIFKITQGILPDALSVLCAYNVPALANVCRLPSPGFHDLECSSFAQRRSENVARFVLHEMEKCKGVETELIGILGLDFPNSDAAEALKHEGFSETVARADGLVLVVPEYNHGYPGLLKHVLDSNLKEYIHKAVGVRGVSAGGLGGPRVIENLLPVLRKLGLVTIFWDGNFSGAQELFDGQGKILDNAYVKRIDKFLGELIWMSKVLRYCRESVSI